MKKITTLTIFFVLLQFDVLFGQDNVANDGLKPEAKKETPLSTDKKEKDKSDSIPNLLNHFKYAVFTDFKGFSGDQPNGLVQTEFTFNFKFRGDSADNTDWHFFHNIMFGVNLSKIGNNLRYKELYNSYDIDSSVISHLHFIDLVRYNNLEANIKLNLLKINFHNCKKFIVKIPLRFYADGYVSLLSTGIRDTTLPKDEQKFNANTIGYGFNFNLSTSNISEKRGHLDFDLAYNPYWLNCQNNNFRISGGPLLHPEKNPKNYVFQNNEYSNHINRFDFKITYAPNMNTSDNRVFFRIMYHTNPLNQTYKSQGYSSNTFLQLQLGTVGNISSLFPNN